MDRKEVSTTKSCQRAFFSPSPSILVCSCRHTGGLERQLGWTAALLGCSPVSRCPSLRSLYPQVNPSLHASSCCHSWIAAAWFRALKSRMPANSSKSLSWMAMPFPSPSRSQPSPSGQTVKIVSGSEPPSSTSSLFFKPKHQYHAHMRMSRGFISPSSPPCIPLVHAPFPHFRFPFCFQKGKLPCECHPTSFKTTHPWTLTSSCCRTWCILSY